MALCTILFSISSSSLSSFGHKKSIQIVGSHLNCDIEDECGCQFGMHGDAINVDEIISRPFLSDRTLSPHQQALFGLFLTIQTHKERISLDSHTARHFYVKLSPPRRRRKFEGRKTWENLFTAILIYFMIIFFLRLINKTKNF